MECDELLFHLVESNSISLCLSLQLIMPRLFPKSQSYNVAKKSWLARIILLDSTTIEINLQPHVTGNDCLERVAQCMDINEVCVCLCFYVCVCVHTRLLVS